MDAILNDEEEKKYQEQDFFKKKDKSDEEILNIAMISLNGELYADTEKKSRRMGNAVRKAIRDAISEARKQVAEEIFRKEPDELIENARLKADLAMAYAEIEILQNQLKESERKTAKTEFILHKAIADMQDLMIENEELKRAVDIEKSKTAGLLEDIFTKFDEYACIKNDKWYLDFKQELKEKYPGEKVIK